MIAPAPGADCRLPHRGPTVQPVLARELEVLRIASIELRMSCRPPDCWIAGEGSRPTRPAFATGGRLPLTLAGLYAAPRLRPVVLSSPRNRSAHRQRFQTNASVGSDIVTRFFTLGRSCIFAYQAWRASHSAGTGNSTSPAKFKPPMTVMSPIEIALPVANGCLFKMPSKWLPFLHRCRQ